MNIGLSGEHIKLIVDAIKESGAAKAVVYGSRAKGNWRENSDIDIAVFGGGVNIGRLHSRLDDLPMPYKFDVTDYDAINHVPLREHIDRVGVEIYVKIISNNIINQDSEELLIKDYTEWRRTQSFYNDSDMDGVLEYFTKNSERS